MFLCERDLSKECKVNYKDCTDCVLDKIREDINSLHNGCGLFNDGVDATLKIIDKYRTENRND